MNSALIKYFLITISMFLHLAPTFALTSGEGNKAQQLYHALVEPSEHHAAKIIIKQNPALLESAIDEKGNTLLHWAILHNHIEAAFLLIQAGAPTHIPNKAGKTVFHLAAATQYAHALLSELIPAARKQAKKERKILAGTRSQKRHGIHDFRIQTEIVKCLRATDVEATKLKRSSPRIHIQAPMTDAHGQTPLHIAALNGNMSAVAELLKLGLRLDDFDHNGNTPLSLAASQGYEHIIIYIHESPFNVNRTNVDGCSMLHEAVRHNELNTALQLWRMGAHVNITDPHGETPLHYAVRYASIDIILFLLLAHANINQQNNEGLTPLHLALLLGRENISQLLIHLGADPNIPDRSNNGPLHYAVRYNRYESTFALVENVDTIIDAHNSCEQSPYDIARSLNHRDIGLLVSPMDSIT